MNKNKKILHKHNVLSHDEMFRKSLENPVIAREFIISYLPCIAYQIDLNSLEPRKENFVEEGLKKSLSDVLFQAKFDGKDGYLYLLFEHQSRSDYWMSFRLLKYIVNILDHHKTKNPESKKLPPVYAAVFYNGKYNYTAPLNLFELFENPEVMEEFFINGYQLIDVTHTDDDKFKKNLAGIVSSIMKHINEADRDNFTKKIITVLKTISNIKKNYNEELINSTIQDILCYTNINKEELTEIQKEVKDMPLAAFAREFKEEGIQIGIEQGIEKGMQKGIEKEKIIIAKNLLRAGVDIDVIVDSTELTKSQVLELKNDKLKKK